jgi:hypothetical protein
LQKIKAALSLIISFVVTNGASVIRQTTRIFFDTMGIHGDMEGPAHNPKEERARGL